MEKRVLSCQRSSVDTISPDAPASTEYGTQERYRGHSKATRIPTPAPPRRGSAPPSPPGRDARRAGWVSLSHKRSFPHQKPLADPPLPLPGGDFRHHPLPGRGARRAGWASLSHARSFPHQKPLVDPPLPLPRGDLRHHPLLGGVPAGRGGSSFSYEEDSSPMLRSPEAQPPSDK